jgi:hypothetical protein
LTTQAHASCLISAAAARRALRRLSRIFFAACRLASHARGR